MSTLTALRDKADASRGTGPLGFYTDAHTSASHVAIAISIPAASFVFTVEKAEYDGRKLMALLGFPTEPKPGEAHERAIEAKVAMKKTTARTKKARA